ncbi:hypothetical protein BJ508DRAFT_312859, partial [Ascobolus immersus RN42]
MVISSMKKQQVKRQGKLAKLAVLAPMFAPKLKSSILTTRKRPGKGNHQSSGKKQAVAVPDPVQIAKALGFELSSIPRDDSKVVAEGGSKREVTDAEMETVDATAQHSNAEEKLTSTIADDFASFNSEDEEYEETDKEDEKDKDAGSRDTKDVKPEVVDLSQETDGDDDEDYVEPARHPKRQTRLAGKGGRLSYAVPEGARSELEAECDEVLQRGAREVILWDGCKSTVGDWSTFVGVLAEFSDAQARCMELFGPSAVSKILLDVTRVMNRKLYGQEPEGKKRVKVEVIEDAKEKREKKTEVRPVLAILKLLEEMKEVAADWPWRVGW